MKTKLILMAAVMAFTYSTAQQTPDMNPKIKLYSKKIDSIVVSEKSKMNAELDIIDKDFKEKKITAEEKQKQRSDIAMKYQQTINEKVDAQESELQSATKEMVKNAVFMDRDSMNGKRNEMWLGLNGLNMKLGQNRKKSPKHSLQTIELSASVMGTGLTAKNEPFNFYDKNSDTRNTIINSSQMALRYEGQIGGFKSPVFYRVGLGVRFDQYVPKYGNVFKQEDHTLFVDDFDRGNLKKTQFNNTYLYIPVDLRFVLNPKYIEYEGVQYLDNKKRQLSLVMGVYGGVKVGSVNYIKYSNENSKRIVERERIMDGVNDFIVGGKFGISYGSFKVFVQKDFTPIFNDSALLKNKYGVQIGVEFVNIVF
ncbi:MICOS complex subunit MIC60 [Chryseobacterium antibioticum]|uniref:MICOS complex subunit MIC60 n=1 Tax=Chryseobacterium pyrolae TaxID=2987481 RepID=A0ABT2ILZ3_9FLAO|nr:MICOS complex subunit MIC60 [Chryseobacterium pyrolae]MCT2409671.1 MICOS complex subunit MIC60 [Chryseobacterium pyrolae]